MASQRRQKEKDKATSDLDNKVDVHVLVVPSPLWRSELRFAYNSVCVASVSCGFVRALPSITLRSLRDEILQQLDPSLFPSDFVFLRSIGKCLTWVTPKQEISLKLRLFLPPLAPCPEMYVLDSTCLQLPDATMPLPLHSVDPSMYSSLHGRPMVDNNIMFNSIMHHNCPTTYYHQQYPHTSLGSHPHSCTPPTFAPIPPLRFLSENANHHCVGQSLNPGTSGYHSVDMRSLVHVSDHDRKPQNKSDCRTKKDQNVDERQSYNSDQIPVQYLNPEQGLVDVRLSGGKASTQHRLNQNNMGRTHFHNKSKVHSSHDRKVNNLGQALNQRLGEDSCHQSSLVSHNSNQGSGVNHRQSANGCEEANELDKRKQQNHSVRAHPPQAKMSLSRNQAPKVIIKGSSPCPDKEKSNNPCPDMVRSSSPCPDMTKSNGKLSSDCHHSNNHYQSKHYISNGSRCDRLSSNEEANPFNYKEPVEAGAIHHQSSDYEAVHHSPDPNQLSDELQHNHPTGQNNRKDDFHSAHQFQEISYSEIGGSYSHGEEINCEAGEQKCGGESDIQVHNSSTRLNKGSTTTHYNVQKQEAQSTSERHRPQPHQQNASRPPHMTRKAAASKQNPDRTGVSLRKRSATFPPIGTKHSKNARVKADATKRPQLLGKSHISVPTPTNKGGGLPRRGDAKFSRPQADLTSGTTTNLKSASNSRNDEFSCQIPLPPIGSTVDDSYSHVKKKSTAQEPTARSHSQANRPSTRQTNETLALIRKMKEECDELSSNKAELSSVLRTIQHDLKTQRELADKEWKRKFVQEKKFTSTLEDRIRKARDDLQQLQGQLDKKHGSHLKDSLQTASVGSEAPSELSNMKIRCKKHQTSIKSVREQLDTARKRLAAEKNARISLENECKDLRKELLKKKIACTRTKRQPVSAQS